MSTSRIARVAAVAVATAGLTLTFAGVSNAGVTEVVEGSQICPSNRTAYVTATTKGTSSIYPPGGPLYSYPYTSQYVAHTAYSSAPGISGAWEVYASIDVGSAFSGCKAGVRSS